MHVTGLPFRRHRKRKKFPQAVIAGELAAVKQAFMTAGNTGKVLYDLMYFVKCNGHPAVQPQTLELVLALVQQWLAELYGSTDVRAALIFAIGRADHAANWSAKFFDSRDRQAAAFARVVERIALAAQTVLREAFAALEEKPQRVEDRQLSLFDQPGLFDER